MVYDVPVSDEDSRQVDRAAGDQAHGIDGTRPMVAINPVALWETKLWFNDRFAMPWRTAWSGELGVDVVFTGGPGDRPVIDEILSMMTVSGSQPCRADQPEDAGRPLRARRRCW